MATWGIWEEEGKKEDECVQRWFQTEVLRTRHDHRQLQEHPAETCQGDISLFPVTRQLPRGVAKRSQGSAFRLSSTEPGLL